MDIVSLCPLVASKLVWQAHNGSFALTVSVKATFVLEPGTSVLAPEQEPIRDRDLHWGDDRERSLRIATDRVPYKPRADVLLVGHAHAPKGQPVRSLVTRFVVGSVDKSIEVWCDRKLRVVDGQLLEGQRFTRLPLWWERAAGGPESPNPVGKRFDEAPDEYGTVSVPNLQPPGCFVFKQSDTFVPTCYAPVAPSWPGRAQLLGRLSRKFIDGGWEDEPLPEKFDAAFFQAAPADQQLPEIRADERIVLDNLHPVHSRLETSLPGLRPRAVADRATGEREEIPLVADTLWIDSDRGLCCVVWRGRIGLRHASDAGRITIWADGLPTSTSASAVAMTAGLVETEQDAAATMIGMLPPSIGRALPFVGGTSSLAESHGAIAAQISQWASPTNNDETGTLFVMLDKHVAKALPFEHQQDDAESAAPTLPPQPSKAATTPFEVPGLPVPRLDLAAPMLEPDDAPKTLEIAQFDVAPPPMIGPLAKMEPEQDQLARAVAASPAQIERTNDDGAREQAQVAVADVELSIEQTATIAAELAEGQVERARVLHTHGLIEPAWRKNQARWDAAMAEDQTRGKTNLRSAYDTAYVTRVEGFRGAITANDYAKLLVAMGRGKADATLHELRIQHPALMPIVRVWTKKMAADVKVGKEASIALREAKGA